jgi:hypothetical protein
MRHARERERHPSRRGREELLSDSAISRTYRACTAAYPVPIAAVPSTGAVHTTQISALARPNRNVEREPIGNSNTDCRRDRV